MRDRHKDHFLCDARRTSSGIARAHPRAELLRLCLPPSRWRMEQARQLIERQIGHLVTLGTICSTCRGSSKEDYIA